MSFSKLLVAVFGLIFVVVLYLIIYYALKIMYKDVKDGGKKKTRSVKRDFGLEVIRTIDGSGVREGAVLPINNSISIGRKESNTLILQDPTVSGNHANIIIKNNVAYVEDLNSTNGTYVNGERVVGRVKLFPKDEVKIGNTVFIVLI